MSHDALTSTPKFRMTLSLNVLNHLGIGLYSNIPAVLSELVANAWDADARNVDIALDIEAGRIEVRDDGHGMNVDDINGRFLKVGYQRRKQATETPRGRPVMGRKGIGKLATFSIARVVEVHTTKDKVSNALRMDRDVIKSSINDSESSEYCPKPIPADVSTLTPGTRLILRNLDKGLSKTVPHLRRRLARRFSIIGSANEFSVTVDGTAISPTDRGFHGKLEFLWWLGDDPRMESADRLGQVKQISRLDSNVQLEEQSHHVSGWIGTVDRPKTLDEINNSIVLLSRGRLVHENIMPDFKEAGVYAQYVVGEVNADFLDDTDQDDMVTSGRQSVKEDDPRFEAISTYVKQALVSIRSEWAALRRKGATTRALDYPSVKKWYGRLGPDQKTSARKLFGKIESLPLADRHAKMELYKATILAFERFAMQDMLSRLEDLESLKDFELLARLMVGVDGLEAAHYHEIVRGRLGVIRKLINIAPEAKERVLQKHVFDHLWLLDPSWERSAGDARMEETIMKEFGDIDAKLTSKEKKARVDIRYKTAAGKHIVIELKKYDRQDIAIEDLMKQLRKYRDTLEKLLTRRYPNKPRHIEIVAILGRSPSPQSYPERNRSQLASLSARYITYDEIIHQAEQRYSEYLEKDKKVSEITDILRGLAVDFGTGDKD